MPPTEKKSRNWVFTLNFEGERPTLPEPNCVSYMVWQHERGEEAGHDHLQGYIELSGARSLTWLKNNISREAHFEPRRGTAEQARDYAMKEDTRFDGPWEKGVFVAKQPGRRTDCEEIMEMLKEGRSPVDILRDGPASALRLVRNITSAAALLAPARKRFSPDVRVVCYFGDPGLGKTRRAWADADALGCTPYLKGPDDKWWCGYNADKVVLVDDYGGERESSKWSLAQFKSWTDKYPVKLEVKGGHTYSNWQLMIFTSNYDPATWYRLDDKQVVAVLRRFDDIVYFGTDVYLAAKYQNWTPPPPQ